ncbi:MAG: hypothetical protein AB7O59_25460 [Pirellulales bacterium]
MQQRVFVACPIGTEDSPERTRSDKLLKFVVAPVVKDYFGAASDDVVVRSDTIGEPGRITTQILRELADATVVLADLTGTNPNVMYELGIRQALLKPFVLLAEKGQRLPFDLNDFRTVFYQLDLEHFEEAQKELRSHIEKAVSGNASSVDEALFAGPKQESEQGHDSGSRGLLAVVEVCENILKETLATKDLVSVVGNIALGLREDKEEQARIRKEESEKEMGMFMMSQFFQNPESVDKLLPTLQRLAEMGKSLEGGRLPTSGHQATDQHPNQRKRRRPE